MASIKRKAPNGQIIEFDSSWTEEEINKYLQLDEYQPKNRSLIGDNPGFYELNHFESVDVDTPFDFFIAEQIHEKYYKNK